MLAGWGRSWTYFMRDDAPQASRRLVSVAFRPRWRAGPPPVTGSVEESNWCTRPFRRHSECDYFVADAQLVKELGRRLLS